jgi:SNF2 family DNA or RNA helicase
MKIGHYLFTGKTSDVERNKIREQFQQEDGDLFVLLNTKSGGVSLTLDMADDVVVCDQTWIPDDQEQVEDRAHRVSRNHNVTVWNLASLGTIDEAVAITNAAREDAIFSILEGQRGVAYVKSILSKLKKGAA